MAKELTPEELKQLESIYDNELASIGDMMSDKEFTMHCMNKYAQMNLNNFIEFCDDNYNIGIPPRVIHDFKTTS